MSSLFSDYFFEIVRDSIKESLKRQHANASDTEVYELTRFKVKELSEKLFKCLAEKP